jgi:hypothetical protein
VTGWAAKAATKREIIPEAPSPNPEKAPQLRCIEKSRQNRLSIPQQHGDLESVAPLPVGVGVHVGNLDRWQGNLLGEDRKLGRELFAKAAALARQQQQAGGIQIALRVRVPRRAALPGQLGGAARPGRRCERPSVGRQSCAQFEAEPHRRPQRAYRRSR